MTGFTVNAHRYDPYKNFNFRVLLDGRVVMGVSKVSALKRTTDVVKHQAGGLNSFEYKSPGRTKYEAVTMERGITHDRDFEVWANRVYSYANDSSTELTEYKKDLTLEVLNLRGQVAIRYFLHGCWVSEFTAVPELDANNNGVAIEQIKIEVEGWERDAQLAEPNEAG